MSLVIRVIEVVIEYVIGFLELAKTNSYSK